MKNWLKKSLATLFAISAITVPSVASAQYFSGSNDCNPCGDWDASRFFINSSTMYWKTCVDNTDYAVTGTGFTGLSGAGSLVGGKTHSVDLGWDWGFRVGLGYEFPCGGWDIRANWTSFHTHDHNSTGIPTTGTNPTLQANIMNPAFAGTTGIPATSAKAYAKVNYDTLDILASRTCNIGHDLTIRPYFGARVLWLHRKFHANYAGGIFTGADDGLLWHSKYTAGGLHSGLEMTVDLGCDFFLFANAAGSLVAGGNSSDQTQTVTAIGPVVTTFALNDDKRCLISYNYELSVGAEYRTCLCECWNIDWKLGYEFVQWNNVSELNRITDGASPTNSAGGRNGRVGFHGVTFSSVWRF